MCEFGECFVLRLSGVCPFVTQKKEVRSRSGCGTVKRNCKNENELVKFVLVFVAVPYYTGNYIFKKWISFTVVANLALTASGVGMESYPDSPGGLIIMFYD